MGRRNAGGLLGFGAGYNYDTTIPGVSAFWLLLAVTFFFADGGFAIVEPVGLALIVGSSNHLKPETSRYSKYRWPSPIPAAGF